MRKVLFVHDGPRWKDSSGRQFGTAADLDMYERYKYLGDKVEFMMRVFKVDDASGLININDAGLYVNEAIPFNRPKLLKNYFKSKKEIYRNVDAADIIVVRLPSTIGSVALAYAKKINKPYIVEVVACPWDALMNHSTLGKLYSPLSRNKLVRLVKDSPFVVYVTKNFLQNRYPTKHESTNISNVILKGLPEENTKIAHYANFDKNNRLVISTLGVVNLSYKGQQYVMQSVANLLKEGYDIVYNIVGGGDDTRLKQLAHELNLGEHVIFSGKLPHNAVFEILERTDLYIQPSETEGLPRALIEAMSRGCACIASNAGGMPELLDDKAIFKSKDVNDLTAKIKSFLDKDVLTEQSKKNFLAAKDYSYENLQSRRKAFYDKFLESIHEK